MQKERPPVFYKYFPVEPWLPNLFIGNSLLFSSRTTFNDPFDCRPVFRVRQDKKTLNFYHKGLRNNGLSPAKSFLKAKEVMRRVAADNTLSASHTHAMLDNTGILCLSTNWDNPLMWSHYAKFHKGICVGFHSDKEIFRFSQTVLYTNEPPIIFCPVQAGPELFAKTFLMKAKCWEYEDEWRIIKPNLGEAARERQLRDYSWRTNIDDARRLADQRGPGIYEFSNASIESVTLGMNISEDDTKKVTLALTEANLGIPVYKVHPPSTTYFLSRELVKVRS
jgi:hypothetical protein